MYYFIAMGALLAVIGLAALSAAHDVGMTIFGGSLFLFGVLFALFLLKRHFDHADGSARP
jgi:hypothetical protein